MRLLQSFLLVSAIFSTSFRPIPIVTNLVSSETPNTIVVGRNKDLNKIKYTVSEKNPSTDVRAELAVVRPVDICYSLQSSDLPDYSNTTLVQDTAKKYSDIRCQLSRMPEGDLYLEGSKISDLFLLALIVQGEFGTVINRDDLFYLEALEAVSFEYRSDRYIRSCQGNCQTIKDQITLLIDMQSFRQMDSQTLINAALKDLSSAHPAAQMALDGYVHVVADSVTFGNYTPDSAMGVLISQGGCAEWMECQPAFTAVNSRWNAVVFSAKQNLNCRSVRPACVGW